LAVFADYATVQCRILLFISGSETGQLSADSISQRLLRDEYVGARCSADHHVNAGHNGLGWHERR